MKQYLVFLALAALTGLTAVVGVLASGSSGPAEASGRVVLLAADGVDLTRLPLRSEDYIALNIERVATFSELRQAGASDTSGILIEAGVKDGVDWTWVQSRFAKGVLVAGININMGELLSRLRPASQVLLGEDGLGWRIDGSAYSEDRLFYSMLVTVPGCGSGGAFDHFDRPGLDRLFVARLKTKLTCTVPPGTEITQVGGE